MVAFGTSCNYFNASSSYGCHASGPNTGQVLGIFSFTPSTGQLVVPHQVSDPRAHGNLLRLLRLPPLFYIVSLHLQHAGSVYNTMSGLCLLIVWQTVSENRSTLF